MKRHTLRIGYLLLALALAAFATEDARSQVETSFGGNAEFSAAFSETQDTADFFRITVRPEFEAFLTDRIRMAISGRARYDTEDRIAPGRPDLSTYDSLGRPLLLGDAGTLELRDAFIELDFDHVFLKAGKQQIIWGELEGFKILDAVNPQSFREFILEDFDESRIGLWSLSAEMDLPSTHLGEWTAQAVWVPDTTVHEIPERSATFEFQTPRFRFGQPLGDPLPARVSTERPSRSIDNGGIGIRFIGFVDGWDVTALAYSGTDHEPIGRVEVSANGAELTRLHRRRDLFGASAARTFGSVTLRTEIGVQPNRTFVGRDQFGALSQIRATQTSAAFVADLAGRGDLFSSVQIIHDSINSSDPNLVRPNKEWRASLFMRKQFAGDRGELSIRWLGSLNDGDGLIRPKFSYDVSDQVRVSVGADLFYGRQEGAFGQFKDNDRLVLSVLSTF